VWVGGAGAGFFRCVFRFSQGLVAELLGREVAELLGREARKELDKIFKVWCRKSKLCDFISVVCWYSCRICTSLDIGVMDRTGVCVCGGGCCRLW
jgi:hypothetical protein